MWLCCARCGREHPRAGGDDYATLAATVGSQGTPPRWRGRHLRRVRRRGRTTSTEHPRAGGDDLTNDVAPAGDIGTPPRWRGRRAGSGGRQGPHRNTPALAGTTRPSRRTGTAGSEHPRAGGDDGWVVKGLTAEQGTPPRWRGRRRGRVRQRHRLRNTPALAGTTTPTRTTAPCRPEHPRAGGDDDPPQPPTPRAPGTPPRWRGRHIEPNRRLRRVGNTPALAGTTRAWSLPALRCAEHPRAGGDDQFEDLYAGTGFGTPPRWRGRHARPVAKGAGQGTSPRWRGRHARPVAKGAGQGTSPRWRGRPRPQRPARRGPGNTPALAGTTTQGRPRHLAGRNTPALAGTTRDSSRRRRPPTEQPRAGGDDPLAALVLTSAVGTPPRWRGRPAHARAGRV